MAATLPFGPLEDHATGWLTARHQDVDDTAIAVLLGVSRRSIAVWRRRGDLGLGLADRLACRLGLHPSLIWPEWWSIPVLPEVSADVPVVLRVWDDCDLASLVLLVYAAAMPARNEPVAPRAVA